MKKLTLIMFFLLSNYLVVLAQENEIRSKSSFSRESITKYYKTVVDAGSFGKEDGKYTFGASFFGIKKIFKDSSLNIDTVLLKKSNRNLRNIELDLTIVPMEGNKIKSFTPSIKVALINNRDEVGGTYADFKGTNDLASTFGKAVVNVIDSLRNLVPDSEHKNYDEYNNQYESLLGLHSEYDSQRKAYNNGIQKDVPLFKIFGEKLNKLFHEEFLKINSNTNSTLFDVDLKDFDPDNPNALILEQWEYDKNRISRRSLVTLHTSPEFSNGFNSFGADLVWLKGLNTNAVKKPASNLEVFAKYLIKKDTINVESEIGDRATLSLGANFNRVLSKDSNGDSNWEFKGGFDVLSILNGVYQGEDDQTFNLNFVLSAKLTKDVYLPIEVKWDPVNANVFGFLNLTWNFTNGK